MKSFIVQAAVFLVLCGNAVQGDMHNSTNATEAPTNATAAPTNATEAPTNATEAPTNATMAPTMAPTNYTNATYAPTNYTNATYAPTNYTNYTEPPTNASEPTSPPTEDSVDGGDESPDELVGTCGLGEVGNGVCFDQRLCCSNSGHCFATCEEGESSSTRLASSVLGAILMGAVSMSL